MLTLIRSSIARELIATLAVGLGLTVGASFAIADYTIGAIEASYENIIFGRIIPDIQHMGDSGFDAEEQSIAREEASAGDALLAEAAAKGSERRDETYAEDDFRSHISDRRIRGGIDKLGSLFVFPDEAKGVVWIYRGMHDNEGHFKGVKASAFTFADPGVAAESLRSSYQDRTTAFDRRRSDLADKRMAFSKVKGVVDSTIDQIQASRGEMVEFKHQSRVNGSIAVLVIACLGGAVLGTLLYRLACAIARQGKTVASIIADAGDPAKLEALVVPDTHRIDQLGVVARGIAQARDAFSRVHLLEGERLALERSTAEDKVRSLRILADHFEATVKARVEEVASSSTAIGRTANSMAEYSEQGGGRSISMGDAAHNTNERASVVSAATRQLAASVNEIAQQVGHSTAISRQAVDDVNATAAHMRELSQAVQAIGEIVQLISDIAAQTNLLALNATMVCSIKQRQFA